jgi:serine/threonine protein kinase
MGEVYRARDERLERDVALKVISSQIGSDSGIRKRFRKEALALSRLSHPNIATILDYDTVDGIDFLVMEHIAGATLREKLEESALPERDILSYAIQIAFALEEAHAAGVVHRDLKPNNFIVTPKGQLKVLDFGLAKLVQTASHESETRTGTEANLLIGTLAYMSPEQLRGEPVDARCDIYTFGVVLYEMCTGKRPHQETQPITLADAILHKPPAPIEQLRSDLSPLLQQIISRCLEKDLEKRYQSIKDLLFDLRSFTTPSMSGFLFANPVRHRVARIKLRRFALPVGVVLLILSAIVFSAYITRIHGSQSGQSVPKIDSIVALPSKVFGSDENLFLSDAVPNALSTYLSRVEGLETKVPPTSQDVERFGGNLDRIAKVYGVNTLISSSVTADADYFILKVQLMEAAGGRLLWKHDYDGRRDSYLEIVRNAAEGLRQQLRPGAAPIQSPANANHSSDAELVYQRGFYHLRAYANRKDTAQFSRALSDLQHALEVDPTNARAAAAIARLYSSKIEAGAPLGEVLPEIDRWAYRALQLDYRCGEAWQVLSVAEEMRPNGDKRKRLEYALKAATYASSSGYSHHVLGSSLSKTSFVLALQAAQEGIRREPLHLNGLLFASGILARQDDPKAGLKLIDQVQSIEPNMPIATIMKVWLLLRDHRFQEAGQWSGGLDKMVAEHRLHPGWVDFGRDWLDFEKSAGTNDKPEASAAMARLVSAARGESPPFPRWEVITGNVLSIQARHDPVASTLETLSIRSSKGILEPYDWLLSSPELEQVRKDPRFQDLLPGSRSEFQKMLAVLEEARKRNELPSYLEKPLAQARSLP